MKRFLVLSVLIIVVAIAATLNNPTTPGADITASSVNLLFDQVETELAANADLTDITFTPYETGDNIIKGSDGGDPLGILTRLYTIVDATSGDKLYPANDLDNLIGQLNATCNEPEVNSNNICSGELNDLFKTVLDDIIAYTSTVTSGGSAIASTFGIGAMHGCYIDSVGDVHCWGWNARSQLGDNSTSNRNYSQKVSMPNGETAVSLWSGLSENCVESNTGSLYCWGYNQYWQLGEAIGTPVATPTEINLGISANPVKISLGERLGCGIFDDNKAYCWG